MNTRKSLALLLLAVMAVSLVGCSASNATPPTATPASGSAGSGTLKIGVSLPTQREERWVLDKENFEKVANEQGIDLALQVADNDAAKQQNQCENLISQNIDALIIAPVDGEQAKNIVEMAHAENIPVIAYDRPILNADVDLYVTFDQYRIGQLMGEYVANHLDSGNIVFLKGDPQDPTCVPLGQGALDAIQAKVDSGDYKIVSRQDCKDWSASEAQKHVENALTSNDNKIDAVIAPNDGTAGGAIQALAAQGLAGKTIITGQDSEVDAIKRIIEGTQNMTVFFDVRDLAKAGFNAAVKLAKGEDPSATTVDNNGFKDVPTVGFAPSEVTIDNYKALLIESGYMSEADLG